jgi:hypothetical protein
MNKFHNSNGGGPRALRALPALLAFACAFSAFATNLNAQSGRRSPNISKSSPKPSGDTGAKGESESGQKPETNRVVKPTASFVVFDGNNNLDIDFTTKRIVLDGFMRRLGQSPTVAVSQSGRGSRKDARERAKNEKEAFVVLVELEEESADGSMRTNNRTYERLLVIKTYVYAPVSGDLKFHDRLVERPYRPTASVGGVRVPVPSSRRYPTEQQIEQVGRDAADRLLSRFQINAPLER